jgi:hypothetical protein
LGLFPIIPDLLRLFPTQSANNPSPKKQKQPKTSPSKMQQQLFFFYHTTKIFLENISICGPCKLAQVFDFIVYHQFFSISSMLQKI